MWLIARRTFAQGWVRLTATLLAVLFSVGLMAGSLQFALRAQDAVSGSDASEYRRPDVLVQSATADPVDPFAAPAGQVRADRLRGAPGVAAVAGDAVVPVVVAGAGGKAVTPPAGASTALRPWVADPRLNPYHLVSGRAPASPGEVAVSRHIARAGHLGTGDELHVLLPERMWNVRVVGVVTVDGRSAVASGDLVLVPPEVVHWIARLPEGAWQRLWVKAAPGVPVATLRRDLAGLVGSSATVRTAADLRHAQSAELVTGGAALGGSIGLIAMVAVFVGLFVVANTFNTLVRQRARQLALLAAIGARPRQIKRLIRLEALVLGVVASAGGLLAGYGVSEVLTRLFAADGFDISAGDIQLGWIPLAAPVAAGIVVTQLAAWRAARRAALVAPMEALRASAAETKGRSRPRWLAALAIFGASWMFFGPVFAVAGDPETGPLDRTIATTVLIAMGMMVCAVALAVLTPLLVRPLGGLIGRIGTMLSGEAGRLACATITRSPRRVAAAASALMLGVALAATTGLLVTSVQHRFAETGAASLTADHVIAAAGKSVESTRPLPADVAARVSRVPGVTRAVGSPRPRPGSPPRWRSRATTMSSPSRPTWWWSGRMPPAWPRCSTSAAACRRCVPARSPCRPPSWRCTTCAQARGSRSAAPAAGSRSPSPAASATPPTCSPTRPWSSPSPWPVWTRAPAPPRCSSGARPPPTRSAVPSPAYRTRGCTSRRGTCATRRTSSSRASR
jgi:putative ABC transport system permease protein